MAYYSPVDNGAEPELQNYTPSQGLSFRSAVSSTWNENPSVIGYDYYKSRGGEKLDRLSAERIVEHAGISLKIPESGYSREALDFMIQRQQDINARQLVDERTPWGFSSVLRGSAQLMAGIIDPINIAASFIPVVGEARYAGRLAQAGEGFFARAAVRAEVGALEGAVGAAVLEPLIYTLHSQLEDDYTMSDSLANLAFGAGLGGVLHTTVGGVRDVFRPPDLKRAVAAEAERLALEPAVAARVERMITEADLATVRDAPFSRRADLTEPEARATAFEQAKEEWRAELLSEAGGRAEPRAVPEIRAELSALEARAEKLGSEQEFKRLAKELQGQGMSRKQAESAARKDLANQQADIQASTERLQGELDKNAKASQAEQQLAELDKGNVPERFAQDLEQRAQAMVAANTLVRSLVERQDTPAAFVVGMADPQVRATAMRSALSDLLQGKVPEVNPIIRGEPMDKVLAARDRDADTMVGSAEASKAGDKVVREAKDESLESAQEQLDEAADILKSVRENLELAGYPAEKLKAIDEALSAFDEGINDAKNIGAALMQNAVCGLRQ